MALFHLALDDISFDLAKAKMGSVDDLANWGDQGEPEQTFCQRCGKQLEASEGNDFCSLLCMVGDIARRDDESAGRIS